MVEYLYEAIKSEIDIYLEFVEKFGAFHPLSQSYLTHINNMENEFKTMAGISYTQYLINKVSGGMFNESL